MFERRSRMVKTWNAGALRGQRLTEPGLQALDRVERQAEVTNHGKTCS